jgi:hypothetical protein
MAVRPSSKRAVRPCLGPDRRAARPHSLPPGRAAGRSAAGARARVVSLGLLLVLDDLGLLVREAARAGNRRFGLLSALIAHTNAPHKTNSRWKRLRAHNRPGRARTG